jgi:hypothetical protein
VANDEQGDFYSMADGVDGSAENKIFKPSMAVRGHNHDVRLHFCGCTGDFFGGIVSVPHDDINLYVCLRKEETM